ncbi:MAG: B12-binding domain-containing protein [Gammaproteobacteria bacterium]
MAISSTDDDLDLCGNAAKSDVDPGTALLSRTIEGEIIPRLMMTFSVLPSPLAPPEERDASGIFDDDQEVIDELIQLLLHHDADVAVEFMQALREKGATLRDMYLDLLAPAARQLGEMWEEDTANFAEVTIGVSRLHQILLRFSPLFCANATEHGGPGHTAAIFALPGETHTFGIFMVVEFFRRAGWDVFSGSLGKDSEVHELLSTHHVDLVGLSVSSSKQMDKLPERIEKLRKASRNPDMHVLCGGSLFAHNPHLAKEVGADGYAPDGKEAVSVAASFMDKK